MLQTPPTLLTALGALFVLSGCSSSLKLAREEPRYVLDLRQEYFAANPEGKHNRLIENGEVTRGMGALEVLCSWGHPQSWRKRTPTTETWFYREVDESSKDWIQFEFTFRNGVLEDWELRRHLASGGSVDLPVVDRSQTLTRGEVTKGKRVPEN